MNERKVLVIGGAGFIGRALTARLLTDRRQVHVLTRGTVSQPIDGARYHIGSMDDRDFVLPLLRACPTVIHAASGTTPGSSSRTPTAETSLNIAPTLGFLEIAREKPPTRIVFISSGGTIYADATEVANEHLPLLAHSYHGAGKIALEAFLNAFAWDTGCSLISLRPSNVYGPGQEMRRGFGFIRGALECALHGGTLEIWGDGTAVRDFLYIDDLVAAMTAALATSKHGGKFNIANGVGHTLNEVVDIVRRVSGRPITTVYRGARRSDIRKVSLDVSLVEHHLGWRARVDLEQGIARTWEWLCAV